MQSGRSADLVVDSARLLSSMLYPRENTIDRGAKVNTKLERLTVVGIDCATLPSKTGLTLAEFSKGTLKINECRLASSRPSVAQQVFMWIGDRKDVVLAIDSPLGWPAALGKVLSVHKAGLPLMETSDQMFRRRTDEVVRADLRKAPLEVGADRIARTAVTALTVLAELGAMFGKRIRIGQDPALQVGVQAIEVYPAGTLRAYEKVGYLNAHGSTEFKKRLLLKKKMKDGELVIGKDGKKSITNEHVLDSILCAVAAADFLAGNVRRPESKLEKTMAIKEGWIWVRSV